MASQRGPSADADLAVAFAAEEVPGVLDSARVEVAAAAHSSDDQVASAAWAGSGGSEGDMAIVRPDLGGSERHNLDPQGQVHYRFLAEAAPQERAKRGTARRWAGVEADLARWTAKALASK